MRQLKCFIAAADLENFTAASERMNMSQSALSRQIANLESHLGVSLFDRTAQGVSLSKAGMRLRNTAERLINEFAALRTVVRSEGNEVVTGSVVVAASFANGGMLFPRLSRAAARTHPGIKVHFIEARSQEIEESVLNGKADFGVMTHAQSSDALQVSPLFQEGLYIAYPVASGVDFGTSCSLEEAFSQPLVVPAGGRERGFIERLAVERGVEVQVADDTNRRPVASALTMSYQDFVLLPSSAIFEQKPDQLRQFSRIRDVMLDIYLVERAGEVASDAVNEIKRLVRKDVLRLQAKGTIQ